MATIINNYVEKFKSEIEKYLNGEERPSLERAEGRLLEMACRFSAELLGAFYEQKDREILEDRALRKEKGLTVERRNDSREMVTKLGILHFDRTYYKCRDGGYFYPVDEYAGIDAYRRVSGGTCLALVESAAQQSYARASRDVTDGRVSAQTVMNLIRRAKTPETEPMQTLRKVPCLHIDADEDHVKIARGKKRSTCVPLVTVYEGMERHGKRGVCINSFSVSEYGRTPDEFWEHVASEVAARYDLEGTRVYIHSDAGRWIRTAEEWFPGAVFVLDQYHKNKYIKQSTAGFPAEEGERFQTRIRETLEKGAKENLLQIQAEMCEAHPDRVENITEKTGYLYNNFEAIDIRRTDEEANNGGCTEPHVSHVLSSRLSTRPMAWSRKTLEHFAPILASGRFVLEDTPVNATEQIDIHQNEEHKTKKRGKHKKPKNILGLPDPTISTDIAASFGGHLDGLYGILRPLMGFSKSF